MKQLFPADPGTTRVVHYIVSHTEPGQLGATKLNKVMWKADVLHYRRYGKSITGQMSYVRMPQGPVPNYVKDALDELKSQRKISEREAETPAGTRREFVWLERAPADGFSAQEIETLHDAIDAVCRHSASSASSHTHDALWEELADGEQMPIRAAAVSVGQLEPDDIAWALAELRPAE